MTILWRSKNSHDRCFTQIQKRHKNVTVSLNTWKLIHMLSRTAMSLVASRLRISGLRRKFTIWRKLLFLGVLFHKFSKMKLFEANRPSWHFSIRIATAKTASELFIYFNSVLSWLKPKWRENLLFTMDSCKVNSATGGPFCNVRDAWFITGAWKMAL